MGYDKFEGLNQITDAYQKAVAKTILENELGGPQKATTGYELSHAKIGTSAWSFGGQQLDIGGNKDALTLIKDIATHEQIDWTTSLEAALKSNNSSLLSSTDKFKIDNALSSAYGKEKINESFISAVNNYTSHIDKVEIELQKIKPDLKLSAGEKLMLIDYQNQYPGGISLNSTSDRSLIVKMKEYIRIKGDITPEGLRDLFKTTDQYKKYPDSQGPRIQKSYDAAKELDAQTDNNQSTNDAQFMEDELDKFAENDKTNINDAELTADSDQIKTDGSSDYFVDEENKTIYYFDEQGNPTQVTYDNNSDLLIYGDPANPNKITFTDDNGDYQVWEKDKNGNFVQTNQIDYSQITNTAINQIGSLIIANNQNFSNIEKIAVSSSVATIADFASYAQSGKNFNLETSALNNLQGAVVGFAVSAYFAKNDNISDILGMDGTFVGGIADFALTFTTAYVGTNLFVNNFSMEALNGAFSSSTDAVTGVVTPASYGVAIGAAIGAYLGSALANEIMDWDTKSEAIGSTIGSAVGAIMAVLMATGPIGWAVAALYAFGGSFVGNIIGGIIGGLFGHKKPPPPTANANLEFDEENLEYQIKSLSSANGGNSEAMKNIAESLGKYLVNTFTLPGGQLVDASSMPDINVSQNGNSIKLNGYSGTFADAQKLIANALSVQIPFINVENGNEYVLRAMNRTNEKFLSGNPDDLNRVDINELYKNISLAKDYSVYVNEPLVKDYVDNLLLNNDPLKQDEINHWKEVLNVAKELNLDEHHYSEDYNKLNSEIAKYNYQIKQENNELLDVDYDKYLEQIKAKMLEVYNGNSNLNISKDEAHDILVELGYDLNPTIKRILNKQTDSLSKIEISSTRFDELLKIANILNPLDNFEISDDAFSFAGKSLNDLQFKLENNTLVIKTLDKDLPLDIANEKSQTFTINNWSNWDKTNTNLELPDGTKLNLQELLNQIGVKENQGFVDVDEAFKNIISDETSKEYDKNNIVVTTTGKNTIVTSFKDDVIFAHNGINNISTGLGNDTVSYEKSSEAIYTSLEKGGTAGVTKDDTYNGVENLIGSKYNDVLEGDKANNTLFGKDGNDILRGGEGSDTLDGGNGVDIASYETSTSIQINLKNNYASGGEATNDKFVNIEGIKGSNSDDAIIGDDNANIIYANDGDDVVSGNGGDDLIFGGRGNDYLKGDSGADTLYGEDGNDVLIGGAGDDLLIGGNGKNTLMGDSGTDRVLYKGTSSNFEIIFYDKNTLFIKTPDGKTLDTLKDIEELVFDDAVFKIDYENKSLVKTVEFESYKTTNQVVTAQIKESLNDEVDEPIEEEISKPQVVIPILTKDNPIYDFAQKIKEYKNQNQTNQASVLATAIMIGTVAADETIESSSDEISYLDDGIKPVLVEEKIVENKIQVPTLTKDNPLYSIIEKIKENKQNTLVSQQKVDEINSTYQLSNVVKKDEIITTPQIKKEPEIVDIITKIFKEVVKQTTLTETIILPEDFTGNENLSPLIAPQITLNITTIYEDNNLFGMEILNSNSSSTLDVVFMGLPDTFSMSAGEKRADGNWYLSQNDLIDLKMIPQTNNSDDFELIVKAIVTDSHGRIIISTLTQTIEIIAVADTPNLAVQQLSETQEDVRVKLNILSSLVDTVDGIDGKEILTFTIQNIPADATLNKGTKDSAGVWHLVPSDLEELYIIREHNNSDDFSIIVTAYATETENGDVASISQQMDIVIHAVADTPNLSVQTVTETLEDVRVKLNITSSLVDTVDGVDGKEILLISIQNVPSDAVLSLGVRDTDGIWYLQPSDLENLFIIREHNNSDDFSIIVTAYATETENDNVASISQQMDIVIHAVADTPNLSVENKTFGLEDTQIPLVISSSLVDTLGGPDGEESLLITIENVPSDALLSAGYRDTDGIWYLLPTQLNGLTITPKLNDGDDFTVKVTAYSMESENANIASISEDIFVEVYAMADTPILKVKNSLGDEDTEISLDIKSSLVDDDGSEILTLTIEGVPNGATLNKGKKDENRIWHLTKEDLKLLTITPKLHEATDFTIKVTAKTQEKENGKISTISKDIFVQVNAVADNVIFDLHQNVSGQDAVAIFTEDPGFAFIDIRSSFIDLDGSESVHYIVEGLPLGTTLNNGTLIEEGKWKLMPSDLANLSLNLAQNSDVDFALKVTAVTTEAENQHQTSTTKYIDVKIESAADFATLSVSDTKGYANSFIDLNIQSSLIDNDGSETLEIIIDQVPYNAVLNKGTKDTNGVWHLSKEDLQGLQIRPEFNSIQTMELRVKAIATESKNGSFEESISYMKVNVDPLPSSADITVHQAQAFEDTLCNLNISVDTSDLKPLETIYLELEIPKNCTLNNGEKLDDTKWKLSLDDLQGLNIKTPVDYSGSFFVDIKSVVVKANGTIEPSVVITKLPVDIIAVADKPILEVSNIVANEDDLINLNISSRLKDIDGSENLKIEIDGLPNDATLSVGTKENGIWIVEQKDIESICLLMPENLSGDFTLKIKAISTEKSNESTQEVLKEITLHLNEVIDKPMLHVVDCYIKNNEANLTILGSLNDTDESENLKINISNLPSGATLNKGLLKTDGSYDLTKDDLSGLKILNIDNDVQLVVKSIVNDSQINIIEKNLNIYLSTQSDMYIEINSLQINSDFSSKDIISTTDASDTIKAGGMGDVVHSFGGKDVIYGDTQDGFINTTFNISKDILLGNNELLIFEISNLPEDTSSSIGYFENGKLIIINELFDGNISLSIPNQKEKIDLIIVAKVVDKNDISTIIKTISLSLSIDIQEYEGNDYIDAGLGNDTIYAQGGNDIVKAGDGDDTLFGAEGDDFLSGGKGKDKIDGGDGNDFIVMDFDDLSVNDFLPLIVNGGTGFDTVKIDDTRGVSFDMGITNIEKFIGSDGNDTIIGSDYSDIVIGGKGSDVFYTLGGNDTIYIDNEDIKAQSGNFIDAGSGYDKIYINVSVGVVFDVSGTNAEEIHAGSGNDTIFASSDGNILDGNDGIDTVSFINSNSGVNVNLSTGISSGGFAQGDMIINFENIVGTNFDDVLVGNSQDNIFYAKKGNDFIDGSSGYDNVVIDGSLKDFYNKDLKNIITSFNLNATVITQYGITQMTNIEQITFDDYILYLDGRANSPIVYDDVVNTQEDTSVQINSFSLLNNDFSISGDNLRIVEVKNALNGNVTFDTNGNIIFTPNANYNSSFNNIFDKNSALYKDKAGFEYVVMDDKGNKTTGYTQVNVNAVNDAPEVVSHYFNRNSLYTGNGRFIINDIDSDVSAIGVSVVSGLEGSTNINGRTVENDGEFYFNYQGTYENYWGTVYYEMRPFTVQISDSGDFQTGENKKSILYQTGIYYHFESSDPIVLDLDADGIEIESKYYESFDETLIGVKGNDAVFFWDMDGDKKISSSFETDFTFLDENASNDFDVLRTVFDTNKDGVFDDNDNKWEEFALWQDKNNDGLMSDDEYTNILDSDILKLNLEDKYSSEGKLPIDEYSTYITKDNEERIMASAFIDTTMTPDKLILKEAMVLNEQLATLNQTQSEFYEANTNNNFFDDENQEENIA